MTREAATAFVERYFTGVELFKSKVAAPKATATKTTELDVEVELNDTAEA